MLLMRTDNPQYLQFGVIASLFMSTEIKLAFNWWPKMVSKDITHKCLLYRHLSVGRERFISFLKTKMFLSFNVFPENRRKHLDLNVCFLKTKPWKVDNWYNCFWGMICWVLISGPSYTKISQWSGSCIWARALFATWIKKTCTVIIVCLKNTWSIAGISLKIFLASPVHIIFVSMEIKKDWILK